MISNERQEQIAVELINAFRSLWCDRGLYSEPHFNCGNCEFQRKDDGKCSVKLFSKNHAKVVSNNYYRDYSADRNHVNRVVAEQVRRVIYEDKERIIDRIVAQASRECRSKALKKILEMAGEDE